MISKMKLPEIPGRIMAQMAMAPDKKMNHSPLGVLAGVASVIRNAMIIPTSKEITTTTRHLTIFRKTNTADIMISPKKKRPHLNGIVAQQVCDEPGKG